MSREHMVAPANTIGIFVQACWKAGHKSNFPQSHGYKKNSLPKCYMLLNLFLFPLLFTVILPHPPLTEYQVCAWERHKHSLLLWSDAIMCSDTVIINEKISASSTTYQHTIGKTTWGMAERGVSRVCLVVIGNIRWVLLLIMCLPMATESELHFSITWLV